jgi:hypothetical protein
MNVKLTQWKKIGDHPLVKENSCREFEYEEAASEGCGFINTFTIVYPGSYIVEVNDMYVGIVSEVKGRVILINEPSEVRKPKLIRRTGKKSQSTAKEN